MKKLFAFTFIFILALTALPVSSFASQPLVFHNSGPIAGLQFYFGSPGLPVDLTAIGLGYFEAEAVDIETEGDEIAIIYSVTKDYYYYGSYGSGTIRAYKTDRNTVDIPLVSATLAEHFIIQGPLWKAIRSPFTVEAPPDTSLIFRAVLGEGANTVNFALIIREGELIFAGTY